MKSKSLPIAKIQVPETRVTSYFDKEVYEEFQRTVKTAGVIEPVVVVEVGEDYFLVDGLHRLQEAKAAGETSIQAAIVPGDEKDVFLTNLFLNVMRGKPKVSEMRHVIEVLINDYALSTAQIETKTGLSKGYIEDLVVIGKLPDTILEEFDAGTLSKGAALALTRLSGAELQLRVFAQVRGHNVTVGDIEEIVRLLQEERHERTPPPQHEPPPPVKDVHCDVCEAEHPIKWLKSILVCPDCERELQAWLDEQKKVKKESA